MRDKYDLNPSLVVPIHLIIIIALAQGGRKDAHLNWLFFIPIAVISIYMVFFCASESATSDYPLVVSIATTFFTASDYILLRNHQSELRQIGQKKATAEMSFLERLKWAIQLEWTPRGIGWSHEPTSRLQEKPTGSRIRFIVSQLLWIGFYFLAFDIASIFVRSNPCFGRGGPSLTDYGWLWRSACWLNAILVYDTLSMIYASMSIVSVAICISEPKDWPHLFGSPWDAYTVRNCWGRVWHQILRKFLTAHTSVLAKILHLPKGTFTTYFKLFVSFFMSGLIHYAGDYTLFQNWSGTALHFFMLQAVAITFEDAIIAIFRRLGYNTGPLVKTIGFCWVFAWFTFSLPIWFDRLFHAGMLDDGIKVSLIMGLWKGDWTPKRS